MNELLTVKEFAKEAGTTPSAVYKAIKKGRLNVAKKQGHNTFLFSTELEKIGTKSTVLEQNKPILEQNQPFSTDHFQPFSTTKEPPASGKTEEAGGQEGSALDRIIDLLQEQLQEKDKQLAIKDKQIDDLSQRLAEALQLTRGQQYISAADKTAGLIEAQNQKQEERVIEAPEAKGFFRRIFKKGGNI